MVQFASTQLKDAVSRPVVTGKPIYATDHAAWRRDVRQRIAELNDFWQALATNQSGSTQPAVKIRGQAWADTTTAGATAWYGDPDSEGADDQFATRLTAKDISFATGGTATFKLGGAIDVNTTQVAGSGSLGNLMTYVVPANTLNADGQILQMIGFGTGNQRISAGFGTTEMSGMTGLQSDFFVKLLIVRTGASAQNIFVMFRSERDNNSAANDFDLVEKITGSDSLSAAQTIFVNTVTTDIQEIMLTKYLP